MNAIFDKDDDCCDQTWSYYAHDPRFKNIPVVGLSGLFDNLEECRYCKRHTGDYGVYIDTTGWTWSNFANNKKVKGMYSVKKVEKCGGASQFYK